MKGGKWFPPKWKEKEMISALKVGCEKELKKISSLPTKSAKIRHLHKKGFSRGQISRAMGIRYQHVRNVLITPVKNPITN